MNTLDPLVRAYLRDRRAEGCAPATVTKHMIVLDGFAASFGHRPLEQLGERAVLRWLELHQPWADSTKSVNVSVVRTFARWCERNGHTKAWSADVPKVRRPQQAIRFVEGDEFAATLAEATSSRERAILWLLYGLGLRCVEVARLRVEDWNRRDDIIIATGKRMDQREVPLTPEVRRALVDYLAESPVASGPIIRRADGCQRGLSANTISSLTRRMLRRAGVKQAPYDGRCAHGMRSAAATGVLDATHDIRVAQQLLGHRHLSSTARYVKRVGTEQIRSALAARSDLPTTAA